MAAKTKTNYLEQLASLTRRHLLVFINSRMRVFFTLMVPFIIFVIYIFFLRDLELMAIEPVLAQYGMDASDPGLVKYVYTLVDSWMLSGIVAMCTITVSLQINNITVSDKENGINRDFASSPVSSNVLILSYFLANFIITLVVCLVFLIVCFIYLAAIPAMLSLVVFQSGYKDDTVARDIPQSLVRILLIPPDIAVGIPAVFHPDGLRPVCPIRLLCEPHLALLPIIRNIIQAYYIVRLRIERLLSGYGQGRQDREKQCRRKQNTSHNALFKNLFPEKYPVCKIFSVSLRAFPRVGKDR